MLSEPLSVTYDGVAKSLARLTLGEKRGGEIGTVFRSSNGEFTAFIAESSVKDAIRIEVKLERVEVDTDLGNGYQYLPNRVGLVFEVNPSFYNTSTDIPLLRTALLAWVDSTLQGRLLSGEK